MTKRSPTSGAGMVQMEILTGDAARAMEPSLSLIRHGVFFPEAGHCLNPERDRPGPGRGRWSAGGIVEARTGWSSSSAASRVPSRGFARKPTATRPMP